MIFSFYSRTECIYIHRLIMLLSLNLFAFTYNIMNIIFVSQSFGCQCDSSLITNGCVVFNFFFID